MCGWIQHPGEPIRRRCREKNIPGEPADHALGRSRGGWGSKLHLVTDGQGIPLAVEASAGQAHESQWFEPVMNAVRIKQPMGRPRTRPYALAADKAYCSQKIRDWLRQHKITAVIPTKSNERKKCSFDRERYRQRNVVERCINWLKEARRIATRYEKMAVNFLAMAKLAIIRRCFRILDSSDRP